MRLHALAIAIALAAASCGDRGTRGDPDPPFTIKLIAFNDFHGNLQSPGTLGASSATAPADRPPVGGADFLAAHVARLKARNPLNVVVGAGDAIGASPLISALFHDEPTIETLNRVGLEFNSVGNHEFDKGAAALKRLQEGGCKITDGQVDPQSCKGASVGTPVPFEGAKFKWLSANVVTTATGAPLFPAYGVKTFASVPVAFIGMTLRDTPTIVTPTGVAGLEFRDEARTVNDLVPELKARGIEAIVVLVHEGGVQAGSLSDIDGCEGDLADSAIAAIVRKLDDAVDVVVSGHTHAAYNCRLPNAAGRRIPVTSANSFGRVLTDMDVTIDPRTKDITAVSATNRLVVRNDPAVRADDTVAGIVAAYSALAAPLADQIVGSVARDLPNVASDAACNMPAGALIADSQLAATSPAGFGNAVIAFLNRGSVRNPGFIFAQIAAEGHGNVTYGEAFTVQPFGNSLVTMTLTAQDLKNALEQQFAGCRGQLSTATRIMIPAAGFRFTWDGSRACDARISNVTLRNADGIETIVDAGGTVVNPARTYRVTVNSFMASGGDGFTTFVNGTQRLGGAQDIDAFVDYMAGFKAPKPPYAGDAELRIARIGGTTCPTDGNVNP